MFKPTIKHTILTIIIFVLISFIVICYFSPFISEWYMYFIYPKIAQALTFFSSKINFSLFDVFITLIVILFLIQLLLMLIGQIKFTSWIKKLLLSIISIIIWFYLAWGISYFRFDFYLRTNIEKTDFDATNFKKFLHNYINNLNNSYIEFYKLDYNDVNDAIEQGYKKWYKKMELPYPCGKRKVKKMLYQKWITKTGVSGYFGPFFNEVHVNYYPLPIEHPSIIAHEKAHQFGIANEAECNILAYIICTTSENKYLKYSGYFEALGYIFNNIRKTLPNEYDIWVRKIKPEIIKDYKASIEHWQNAINPKLSEVQQKVYDTYLKANKIETGISNYSEMVELLVSWYNHQNKIMTK